MKQQPENRARFWKAPEFDDLELVEAKYSTHSFPRHMHATYVLGVILEGVEKFYCRGEMYAAPAGSIIVVNPGDVHTGFSAGNTPWVYRCMYPSTDLMKSMMDQLTGAGRIPRFRNPVIRDHKLFSQLKSFHIGLEGGGAGLDLHDLFLASISGLILRHAKEGYEPDTVGSEPKTTQDIREYLHANYAKKITIADLSNISTLSPYHLIRIFKKNTGITPHQYLVNVRIQRARRLLADGEDIVEVAYKTGFSDQSHLTRTFKRIVGITPGRYLN